MLTKTSQPDRLRKSHTETQIKIVADDSLKKITEHNLIEYQNGFDNIQRGTRAPLTH